MSVKKKNYQNLGVEQVDYVFIIYILVLKHKENNIKL